MRRILATAITVSVALATTSASAQVQGVDLNGTYRCVTQCLRESGSLAFVTQYGWQLNVLNDARQPSRGWVEYPGRIWLEWVNQGAIYSPDGMTIQFDGGTIWQRAPVAPPPAPVLRRRG
jgi:hypothetical protein